MKKKYVEPTGYFSKDMQKAFKQADAKKNAEKKKGTKKSK